MVDSPEKRLLKLIEGEETPEGGSQETRSPSEGNVPPFLAGILAAFSPENIQDLIPNLRDKILGLVKNSQENISLSDINRWAKVVTVGLGVYLILSFVYEIKVVNANYMAELADPPRKALDDIVMSERKIFDTDILEEAENVKVFIPISERSSLQAQVEAKPDFSLRLVELTQDFKVAGISISPDMPEKSFCMIEDIKKNITSFLRVGDKISGLEIVEISPEVVILGLEGETVELR
ncbi:MAG: hypothetical protein Q8R76_00050 [Candidatus Omnitrophota bacterium]|nr:hypothetical protein [Candidatus Omnitrophota bacterium]